MPKLETCGFVPFVETSSASLQTQHEEERVSERFVLAGTLQKTQVYKHDCRNTLTPGGKQLEQHARSLLQPLICVPSGASYKLQDPSSKITVVGASSVSNGNCQYGLICFENPLWTAVA